MMSDFFKSQLDYILFLYGSAFLLLIPISLFLRGRMAPKMAWGWLGWFGAIHGVHEWLDLLDLSLDLGPEFDIARLGFLAISFVLLAEFGRASLARMGSWVAGRWILAIMVGLSALGGFAGVTGLFATTRYVLGFGGGCWAAGAFYLAGRSVPLGSRQLKAAALGMLGYALATGLVPNPAPFFPAAWLNIDSFLQVTGFPIQLCRGVLAVWIFVSLSFLAQAYLNIKRERQFRSWFRYLLHTTLTGLAILWIGGWFLTQYFGQVAERNMRDDFDHNVKVVRQVIDEKMTETDHLVSFMIESPDIFIFLTSKSLEHMQKVSSLLDRCSQTLEQSVCYLMDFQGLTINSSNRNRPNSFVGKSYAFRPYFQQAMEGSLSRYWALGVTSREMGYYASSPVRDSAGQIIGVTVVKRTIDELKKVLPSHSPGLIIDPNGIVVMANHPGLVLRSLWPLSGQTQKQLADSRQFGDGPFTPILDRRPTDGEEGLFEGKRLLILLQPGFWQGWSIVSLESMAPITQGRLLGIGAAVVLSMLLIVFLTISSIMRESEEGFRQLFDNAVDILVLHDLGRIVAVNQQACTSLGYTREELIGMSLFDIEVGIGIDDLLNLWHRGGVVTTQDGAYRCRDGSTFPVDVRTGEISYRGQILRLAAGRDVTERKRAEEVLLESEKRFRDVAENAQEWVWEVDAEGKYTYASPIVEKLLGYKPEEILGQHFYDLFIPEDREKLMVLTFVAFAAKQPLREFIKRNLHKNGSIVYLSTSGVPIVDKTGNLVGYRGADIDITERQKTEAALRQSQEGYQQLASKLMTVQEAERQRLARELHDDLTQRLAVLAMETGELELQISNIPLSASSGKLTEIREKLVKLSMDVHAISRRLHPSILDDLGLADAIASECASFRRHNGIKVNYRSKDVSPEIPKETAINIYRIAQEALRNISKHARATTVDVILLGGANSIRLTIKDDGQGIDPKGKKLQGLGLVSMRERASFIGANFSILSRPGAGTVIEVDAPLSRRIA
jgi:PAS domain S-box-containing protein